MKPLVRILIATGAVAASTGLVALGFDIKTGLSRIDRRLHLVEASAKQATTEHSGVLASIRTMASSASDASEAARKISEQSLLMFSSKALAGCESAGCHHAAVRHYAISAHIDQTTGPRYIVVGDSITEGAVLPTVCGHAAINAGIGGANAATFAWTADRLIARAAPAAVVIALGTNNALSGTPETFGDHMATLLGALGRSMPVLVMPIPETSNVPRAAAFNAVLREVVSRSSARLLDSVAGIETTDGIHPSAAGYRGWLASLTAGLGPALCPRTALQSPPVH
jgi:hypothetical protein